MRLGIVTGLADEARIARAIGDAEAGGGTSWGAEVAAEKLVSRGATALVSFGLCGGLDPSLRAGDIVVPLAVIETGGTYPTDGKLADELFGPMHGVILANETIVATREAKRRMFMATRACAVDIESGAVARVAARHGIPFAVLRAVCDGAHRTLPPAALLPLTPDGKVQMRRVMRSVVMRPGQIAELIGLARDAAAARRALSRITRAVAAKGMVNS